MIKIYAEKEIFEEIILFKDQSPNWNKIFHEHAIVFLNMSDKELAMESVEGTAIFDYIHSSGGKSPIALDYHFVNIYEEPSTVLSDPRAVYFLDLDKNEATKWQENYGMIVQGPDSIIDSVLQGSFALDFSLGQICTLNNQNGWECMSINTLPPLNCVIVTDDYLFTTENGRRGTANIIAFLKRILPKELKTDFHILLFAKEPNTSSSEWCNAKTGEIKTALKNLKKPYNIVFEIVYGETIHKRMAISNYFTIVMDKGFALFKTDDLCTVHEDNDMKIEKVFTRMSVYEGQTEYVIAERKLKELKRISESKSEYISNRKNDTNYRIQGDCKKDKTLNNRLINDV